MAMDEPFGLALGGLQDYDDFDLELFNTIMQEPPDPNKLSHTDTRQEEVPSLVSHPLQSLEQASSTALCLDEIDQDCELQARARQNTHENQEDYIAGLSSESLLSDASSESSEFSGYPWIENGSLRFFPPEWKIRGNVKHGIVHESKHDFADESGATNILEDSNASSTTTASLAQHTEGHPSGKVLVDLTTDTDSDCEGEFTESHESFTGKRTFPVWGEPTEKPSKALCLRPSSKEAYNLDSSLNKTHDFQSKFPSYNYLPAFPSFSTGAAKLEPYGLDQTHFEGAYHRGSMPARGVYSNSESTPAMVHSTGGLQDGVLPKGFLSTFPSQMSSARDYSRDTPSRGLLKVLDDVTFKEEALLDEGVMTVSLLKHQRIALAWMEKRERGDECAGGILADDQGLGKTVSTIALILKAKPSAPSSFLLESSKQMCSEASTVDLDDDDDCHMGQLGWSCTSENEPLDKAALGLKGRPPAGTLVVCPTSVLRQWAQELKEKVTTAAALSVHLYHGSSRTKDPYELAKHDIVLTTYSIVSLEVPKQPLPEEKEADERNPGQYGLTSLLGAEEKSLSVSSKKKVGKGKKGELDTMDNAKSGPLAKVAWFRVVLDEAQSIKNRRTQAARACWGLRAKRRWCLSGTPIQNTIDDLYSYFRFLKYDPYSVYKSFRSEIKEPIARDPGFGYQKLQRILHKILLRRTKTTVIDGEPIITLPKKNVSLEQVEFSPEERAFYSNLEAQSRKQFQMYAAEGTVQSNYVNILWMLLRLRQACDHPRLVKGDYPDAVGRSTTEYASKLSDEKRGLLLSILERNCDTCSICLDAPEDAVITLCCHVFCRQCISDRLTHDDSASCPYSNCEAPLNPSAVYLWSALKDPCSGGEGPTEPSLHMLSQPCLNNVPNSSSKIKAVINTLRALPIFESPKTSVDRFECPDTVDVRTEKAIVFSQWTSMLDLLEVSLKEEGFCYRRLDGTMSIQARDRALSDFKHLPKVTVIIMSLKAASLGLNMVAASHVLLIDVWWNPTTEDQAIDRAHRIGQTLDVHVSRFTVKNTIEDRILALQDRKRQMVASAFGEDAGTDQKTRLTVEEMRYLFKA